MERRFESPAEAPGSTAGKRTPVRYFLKRKSKRVSGGARSPARSPEGLADDPRQSTRRQQQQRIDEVTGYLRFLEQSPPDTDDVQAFAMLQQPTVVPSVAPVKPRSKLRRLFSVLKTRNRAKDAPPDDWHQSSRAFSFAQFPTSKSSPPRPPSAGGVGASGASAPPSLMVSSASGRCHEPLLVVVDPQPPGRQQRHSRTLQGSGERIAQQVSLIHQRKEEARRLLERTGEATATRRHEPRGTPISTLDPAVVPVTAGATPSSGSADVSAARAASLSEQLPAVAVSVSPTAAPPSQSRSRPRKTGAPAADKLGPPSTMRRGASFRVPRQLVVRRKSFRLSTSATPAAAVEATEQPPAAKQQLKQAKQQERQQHGTGFVVKVSRRLSRTRVISPNRRDRRNSLAAPVQ